MSRTVAITIVKTIELDGPTYDGMSDDELKEQFQNEFDNYTLDDWIFGDESATVEVFQTKDVVLGGEDE